MSKKVIVIAPHADDEILGCGGTMAKHINQGDVVYVAVMTNAHVGAPELFSKQSIQQVREEAQQANDFLGVKELFFFDLPAPQLEQYPQYKIANCINKLIKKLKVDVVYIPHKGDLHMDHGAIYNATVVATRPSADQSVKEIYVYETLSETEWGHPTPDACFIPTVFNKLTKNELEKKLNAMEKYQSQLKPFPNSRSIEVIRSLAHLRGATVSCEQAEAFMMVRKIKD